MMCERFIEIIDGAICELSGDDDEKVHENEFSAS
jgi:hypothetical protein